MILSNTSIQQALDKDWLKIEPEPSPRRKSRDADECPYDTTAVDLTLGDEIAWFREGLAINIDLRRGRFADLFGPNSESRVISNEQPFALKTGTLVLGKTREKVTLPHLAGRCSVARSSRGRQEFLCQVWAGRSFYCPHDSRGFQRTDHAGTHQLGSHTHHAVPRHADLPTDPRTG